MQRILTAGFVLLLTFLLLSGCARLEHKKQNELLTQTLRTYESTLRWGDLRKAYSFLKPEQAAKTDIPSGLENIQVTGYEVISPPVSLSKDNATQVAHIKYVRKDQQMEKTITDQQLWEYAPEEKHWYLISKVPDFGQPKMHILPLDK
jgi:hypothetical protein